MYLRTILQCHYNNITMKKKIRRYAKGGLLEDLMTTGVNFMGDFSGISAIAPDMQVDTRGVQNKFLRKVNDNSDKFVEPIMGSAQAGAAGMMIPQLGEIYQNPAANNLPTKANGGVIEMPQGDGETDSIPTDKDGNPSSVSGRPTVAMTDNGEVIWNGYVFSDDLGFAKKAKTVLSRYKLRLGDDFSGRDKVSKSQMDTELADLADEQEQYKQINKISDNSNGYATGGGIHIDESKIGTFTSAAKRRGMDVQAFAAHVMANKDRYTPDMVKKANFAKNAAGWSHNATGGGIDIEDPLKIYKLGGSDYVQKNGFMVRATPQDIDASTKTIISPNAITGEAITNNEWPNMIDYTAGSLPTDPLVGLGTTASKVPIIPKTSTSAKRKPTTTPIVNSKVEPWMSDENYLRTKPDAVYPTITKISNGIAESDLTDFSGYSPIENTYKPFKLSMTNDQWALAGNLASTALRGINAISSRQKDFAPSSYTPELMNLESERNDARVQANTTRRMLLNRYRNNRAAQISGATGVDEQLSTALSNSYMKEQGFNVQAENQAKQFTAQSSDKMRELKEMERGATAGSIDKMISDTGGAISGYFSDKSKRAQEKGMLQMIIDGSLYDIQLRPDGSYVSSKVKQ